MNRLLENALENWEKSLFWLVVAIWLAIGAAWLYSRLNPREGGIRPPQSTKTPRSLVNLRTALAFRKPPPPLHLGRDPFLFVLKLKSRAPKPWTKHPNFHVVIPHIKPIAHAKPKPKPKPRPKPPKPKPKPKKKIVRIVQYQGCVTTASGVKMALVRELTTKKLDYLTPGARLGELTILDFDSKGLRVKDPQGKEFTIAFSQKRQISFEEPGG